VRRRSSVLLHNDDAAQNAAVNDGDMLTS